MQVLRGIVVSEGLARGEAFVVESGDVHVPAERLRADQIEREVQRFDRAVQAAKRELAEFVDETEAKLGAMSGILGVQHAFLGDEVGIMAPIRQLIRKERFAAPYAVDQQMQLLVDRLSGLGDALAARVPDLLDVKRRLLAPLLGSRGGSSLRHLPRKVVVIADDLTPSETAALDRDRVLAIVTDRGGPAGHTAILARHLGIPAIVGVGNATEAVTSGMSVIVDANEGRLVVEPDPAELRLFTSMARRQGVQRTKVHLEAGSAHTRDGAALTLYANIDNADGMAELREMGVGGVGLFRTEFLFLGREEPPDEEAQVAHYREVIEAMAPLPVTLRTMDFGADKWDHRTGIRAEPNPFLGLRAIRLSLAHPDIFRAQLRALLRAATGGTARIMFPMINDLGDFRRAKAHVDSVREELIREGHEVLPHIPLGAMVETPAAAVGAKSILREADFLSLGTNDLTQYTLAVDRTNSHVADLFLPHHPSVLRLMQTTVQACREAGKPLSACGEMAGNPRYTAVLLGLGVMGLSMAVRKVPDVVDRVKKLRLPACRRLVDDLLAASDATEAGAILAEFQDRPGRR